MYAFAASLTKRIRIVILNITETVNFSELKPRSNFLHLTLNYNVRKCLKKARFFPHSKTYHYRVVNHSIFAWAGQRCINENDTLVSVLAGMDRSLLYRQTVVLWFIASDWFLKIRVIITCHFLLLRITFKVAIWSIDIALRELEMILVARGHKRWSWTESGLRNVVETLTIDST